MNINFQLPTFITNFSSSPKPQLISSRLLLLLKTQPHQHWLSSADLPSLSEAMPLVSTCELSGIKLNGLAPRSCELCRKRKDGIQRCASCQSIWYCSKDCQAEDWPDHKIPCKLIKKARTLYEKEEKTLREDPDNFFEEHVGRFWRIVETRDYMRARYNYVDTMLMSYGTANSPVDLAETCLRHLLDMLRLSRSDSLGVRDLVPALYIRLGRDQDAYDFVKWYATAGQDPHYDWANMSLPFLNVKDADVFEEPPSGLVRSSFMALSHAAALVLIKVRILLDLQAIQNARIALKGSIPAEVIEMIRGQLVGNVVGARQDILLAQPEETSQLVDKIKRQVQALYRAVKAYNPHFWKLLVNHPDAGVLRRPSHAYSLQTEDEALLVLGYNYAAWYETPGAVDMLKGLGK
ncbi:uncharacterized protein TRIREDRAFT_122500 [Trichoderma reesei QM6a]|uniref:Predicted protein n=1 Tax=Hypocrea jecorina (strain QM6a) TaxID=431241 RepID=G0RN30_HYPJQ|nr:uncharacterized protein TRIREDRAFT_122500 [Trichoderma reesei QM6a]EGR47373.1 predicted protein [Trichoderma reesei QM6a]